MQHAVVRIQLKCCHMSYISRKKIQARQSCCIVFITFCCYCMSAIKMHHRDNSSFVCGGPISVRWTGSVRVTTPLVSGRSGTKEVGQRSAAVLVNLSRAVLVSNSGGGSSGEPRPSKQGHRRGPGSVTRGSYLPERRCFRTPNTARQRTKTTSRQAADTITTTVSTTNPSRDVIRVRDRPDDVTSGSTSTAYRNVVRRLVSAVEVISGEAVELRVDNMAAAVGAVVTGSGIIG